MADINPDAPSERRGQNGGHRGDEREELKAEAAEGFSNSSSHEAQFYRAVSSTRIINLLTWPRPLRSFLRLTRGCKIVWTSETSPHLPQIPHNTNENWKQFWYIIFKMGHLSCILNCLWLEKLYSVYIPNVIYYMQLYYMLKASFSLTLDSFEMAMHFILQWKRSKLNFSFTEFSFFSVGALSTEFVLWKLLVDFLRSYAGILIPTSLPFPRTNSLVFCPEVFVV